MQKTTTDVLPISYTDKLVSWVTACTPIHNLQGESLGALCTDVNAQLLKDTQKQVVTALAIAFLAIYPALIALVLFATRPKRGEAAQEKSG